MCEREKKTKNSLIQRTEDSSQRRTLRGSRQKGFTLVELIVVLVILAIVAAIVMPALLGFIDSGKEKGEKLKAQKALAATQTALSDLYNDASSRLDPKKRSKIREIADSDINDGTEFTIWTEKELRDGYTTATAENIASYTVKKALFKANDQLYFYYNGKSWEKLTSKPTDKIEASEKSNVIYIWPYDGKQDFAYIPGGGGNDPIIGGDDDDMVIKTVTLKLDPTYSEYIYFVRDGKTGSSGNQSVKVIFWKDSKESNEWDSYWYISDFDGYDRFKVDEFYTYKIFVDEGFSLLGWRYDEDANTVLDNRTGDYRTAVGNFIFQPTFDGINEFEFTLVADGNPNQAAYVYVDKGAFSGMFNTPIASVIKIGSGDDTENYDSIEALQAAHPNATRTDDGRNPSTKYAMYSWLEETSAGTVLKWWSNASNVYMDDCSDFFLNNECIMSFDFNGFNMSEATDMSQMFAGAVNLETITLGGNFDANAVTTVKGMFEGCTALTTIDLENFKAEQGELLDVSQMFKGCSNVVHLDFGTGLFNTSNISAQSDGFKEMFMGCANAETINVSGFVTTGIKDVSYMFDGCEKVETLDLSGWDASNFETLECTFHNMYKLSTITFSGEEATGNWSNMSKCTTLASAFENCRTLSSADFGNVKLIKGDGEAQLTDLSNAFKCCYALSAVDLSGWDVSNVTTMENMFSMYNENYQLQYPSALATVNMTGWTASSIINMSGIFRNCASLTSVDLSNFDLTKVVTLDYAFAGDTSLTGISFSAETSPASIELTACTTLASAFEGCSSLNKNFIEIKTTSNLENISNVFNGCSSLTILELEGWNTSGITSTDGLTGAFVGCGALTSIYATENFIIASGCEDAVMFGGNAVLKGGCGTAFSTEKLTAWMAWLDGRETDSHDDKGYFIGRAYVDTYTQIMKMDANWPTNKNWAGSASAGFVGGKANITGFGRFTDASVTTVDEIEAYFSSNGIKAYKLATDGNFAPSNAVSETDPKYYNLNNIDSETGKAKAYQVYVWSKDNKIYWWSDAKYVYINPDSQYVFQSWTNQNLTTIDVTGLDFSKVTKLNNFFSGCTNLQTITGTQKAFHDNTAVTTTASMFSGCYKLTSLDLSNFVTSSNLTDTNNMFVNCNALASLDISKINTSSVINMKSMFSGCKSLTSLNLSSFNTGSVETFENMFLNCEKLETLNISSFNTSNAQNFRSMFRACNALTALEVSNFNTSNATDMAYMFCLCKSLTSLDLSSFETGNVTKMAAMFSECESLREIIIDKDKFNTRLVGSEDDPNDNLIGSGDAVNGSNDVKGNKCFSFEQMFFHCYALESIDLRGFNTSNAVSFYRMFDQCRAMKSIDVSNFDTSRAVHMGNMFFGCITLEKIDISNFSSASLKKCYKMFSMNSQYVPAGATKLSDIVFGADFACVDVEDMSEMFYECSSLKVIDLHFFNPCSLTNTKNMFDKCPNLETIYVTDPDSNEDGKGFYLQTTDPDSARYISTANSASMFGGCTALKGGRSEGPTEVKVKKVYNATYACVDKENQDGYFTAGRKAVTAMLVVLNDDSIRDVVHGDTIYDGWITMLPLPEGVTKRKVREFKRNVSLTPEQAKEMYEDGRSADLHDPSYGRLPVYFWVEPIENTEFYTVYWWSEADIVFTHEDKAGENTFGMFNYWDNVEHIDLQGLDFSKQKNLSKCFQCCFNLKKIYNGAGGSNTVNYAMNTMAATDMSFMFDDCSNLTEIDLSCFDTSKVTSMANMFARCKIHDADLSTFSSECLTNCTSMFKDCGKKNGLYSITIGQDFKCESVTTFEQIFFGCTKLTSVDLRMISTASATNLTSFFNGCSGLTSITFGPAFKCENATSLSHMFNGCSNLQILDLSYFNPGSALDATKTINATNMFNGCSKLKTIYVTDPDDNDGYGFYNKTQTGLDRRINSSSGMFSNCGVNVLVGGYEPDTTPYDSSKTNAEYACVSKPNQPGYFTAKAITKKAKTVPLDASWVSSLGVNKNKIKGFARYGGASTEAALTAHLDELGITNMVDLSDPNFSDDLGRHYSVYFWAEPADNSGNYNVFWWSNASVVYATAKEEALPAVTAGFDSFKTYGMFNDWTAVTQIDLQGFDFSTVEHFTCMFYNCRALLRITSGTVDYAINTNAATDMRYMFDDCWMLQSIDLSGFRTDKVTSMHNMFTRCYEITTLDLSGFNTPNLIYANSMFKANDPNKLGKKSKLKTIYASPANVENGTGFITDGLTSEVASNGSGGSMFDSCIALEGGIDTKYNKNWVSKRYAHIDGGKTTDPGYFTEKQ